MLQKHLFSIIAKDNVDLNSSSNTAAGHYHGTSMTVLQFPLSTGQRKIQNIEHELTVSKTLSKNPISYHRATLQKAPLLAPVCRYKISEFKTDVIEQSKRERISFA